MKQWQGLMRLHKQFYFRLVIFFGILLVLAFVLPKVFSGQVILPQQFNLLGMNIRYYGIFMASAVFFGYLASREGLYKLGLTPDESVDLLLYLSGFGLLGARLYHVLSEIPYYLSKPQEILEIWNGGLSIFGAIIFGTVGLILYLLKFKRNKPINMVTSFFGVADAVSIGLPVGQAIGRLGNLFNYEAYGLPTNLPWKMLVPENFRQLGFEFTSYYHPYFLYEILGLIVIFFILIYFKYRGRFGVGQLFFVYLFLYNSLRTLLEPLRIDSIVRDGIRQNQLVALILVVIAIIGFIYGRKKSNVAKLSS